MSFLSLLSSDGSFSTPIGKAIKEVTDSNVKEPQWMRFISICDMVSGNAAKGKQDAMVALLQRMEEYCGSEKASVKQEHGIHLTLLLIEACLKNCRVPLAKHFPPRLMELMCGVAKLEVSRDILNSKEAGRIIRDLAEEFRENQEVPLFYNTYTTLKESGYLFPQSGSLGQSAAPEGERPPRRDRRSNSDSDSDSDTVSNVSDSDVYAYDENDSLDIARLQRDANVIAGALSQIQLDSQSQSGQVYAEAHPRARTDQLHQEYSEDNKGKDTDKDTHASTMMRSIMEESAHKQPSSSIGRSSPVSLQSLVRTQRADEIAGFASADEKTSAALADQPISGRARATSNQDRRMRTVSYVDVNGNVQDGSYRKFQQVAVPAEGEGGAEAGSAEPVLKFEKELQPPSDSGVIITNLLEFVNIENDLKYVLEKIGSCRIMLKHSPGITEDSELAATIGFLEASRDRVQDILLAGQHGMISDELLKHTMYVLVCIQRALDAEREGLDDFL